MTTEHILSLSYGKDSLACLGAIEQLEWPLDRIVHAEVWATDTIPADLPPMVEFKAKADEIIQRRWGIKVEHFRAKSTYDDKFHIVKKTGRGPGDFRGFPMVRGPWCNSDLKRPALKMACPKDAVQYVGIAADEPERLKRLDKHGKVSPLAAAGWSESMCRDWCEKNDLLSPIYTTATRGGVLVLPQSRRRTTPAVAQELPGLVGTAAEMGRRQPGDVQARRADRARLRPKVRAGGCGVDLPGQAFPVGGHEKGAAEHVFGGDPVRILVACEESQTVTIELRKLGHEAYSCDVQECSGGHPEWHIKGDALELLKLKWDMIIAFPPCTYMTKAGAVRMVVDGQIQPERYEKMLKAKEFFMAFYNADCPRIAIENPTPMKLCGLPPCTQAIQPYHFGHPYSKRTCLWLKGLPPLFATKWIQQHEPWVNGGSKDHDGKYRRFQGRNERDPKQRSKTFPGIAKAMAEQWAGKAEEKG